MEILGQTSYGWMALIPAFVAIILAFKTKNVYISLATGLYSGILLLNTYDMIVVGEQTLLYIIPLMFISFIQIPIFLTNALTDQSSAGIVLQVLFIGGVIQLIAYSGGARHMATAVAKRAKTQKQTQILTWVMGLIVFFDDYANSLIVGPIMRPMIDKMKISREKFAFIIDATAAPIAGIAIISTWIGYELGLIGSGLEQIGIDASPFTIFVQSIPYRFYNVLMLIFIVLTIYLAREFGPMLEVEKMARRGEKTPGFLQEADASETLEEKPGIKSNILDGILPIATLIFGSLALFYINGIAIIKASDDLELISKINAEPFSFMTIQEAFSNADAAIVLFQAALLTVLVLFIRAQILKQYKIDEGIEVFIKGANSLLSTVFVLLFAWSLGGIVGELGASDYLVSQLSETMPVFILPAITFALSGFIAFSTGTSFGTMGIMMPIVIPLAYSINPDLGYVTIAISSILTGATFGDHFSPISDTTILSSMGAGCNHIEHVRTQMPYALTVGAVSTIAYIFAALNINLLFVYGMTIMALVGILLVVGKKVEEV